MNRVVLLGFLLVCLFAFALADYGSSDIPLPTKRRMLFRVPFMMNPDNEQLSRIFRQIYND